MTEKNDVFVLRKWQFEAYKNFKQFNVVITHRQAGKTCFAAEWIAKELFASKHKNAEAAYLCVDEGQGVRTAWKYFQELATRFNGQINQDKKMVVFPGNRKLYLLSAQLGESLRGMTLDCLVVDEVADMPEALWLDVLYPTITARQGSVLFIGTVKGKNLLYDVYHQAQTKEKWSTYFTTLKTSGVFDESQQKEIEEEYKFKYDRFLREYMCDWDVPPPTAYYGDIISRMKQDGYFIEGAPFPNSPVIVSWDIGFDGTAAWFFQRKDNQLYVIDYMEWEDKWLSDMLPAVKAKPYTYEYMILPHEGGRRNQASKSSGSFDQIFRQAGYRTKTAPKLNKEAYIRGVQDLLPQLMWLKNRTARGVHHISQYQAMVDPKTGLSTGVPKKDGHDHAADSLSYFAATYNERTMFKGKDTSSSNLLGYDPWDFIKPKTTQPRLKDPLRR